MLIMPLSTSQLPPRVIWNMDGSIATQGSYLPALFQAYQLYAVFSLHKHAPYLSSGQVAPRKYAKIQIQDYPYNSWQIWVSSPWHPFNEIIADNKTKKHYLAHSNDKQVLLTLRDEDILTEMTHWAIVHPKQKAQSRFLWGRPPEETSASGPPALPLPYLLGLKTEARDC